MAPFSSRQGLLSRHGHAHHVLVLVLVLVVATCSTEAFQPASLSSGSVSSRSHASSLPLLFMTSPPPPSTATMASDPESNDGSSGGAASSSMRQRMASKIRPFGRGLLTAACFSAAVVTATASINSQPAHAATPLPKQAQMPDAEKTALRNIKVEMEKKRAVETENYNQRCRMIEAKDGVKARETYEQEYQQAKQQKEQDMLDELETLQRHLLDKGVDPFNDMEGHRQCFLVKTGRNLAEVEGTDQYADLQMEKMGMTKQTYVFQKAINRRLIKMMVQDYNNRGIDPLPIFSDKGNHEKHAGILFMPKSAATRKLTSFQENMAKYGQIEAPKGGELSLKDQQQNDPDFKKKQEEKLNAGAAKDEASAKTAVKAKAAEGKLKIKAEKEKAKEEARADKDKAKEEARIAKDAAKEEKRIAKEEAKEDKNAAKLAAAAATTAGAAAAAAAATKAAGDVALAGVDAAKSVANAGTEVVGKAAVSMEDFEDDSKFQGEAAVAVESTIQKTSPLVKLGGVVAVAVGGKFVIDRMNQPSAADEEERQKQFNLLMGLKDGKSSGPDTSGAIDTTATDSVDTETETADDADSDADDTANGEKPAEVAPTTPAPQAESALPAPKKRGGRGIKSMFSKKNKNDRETNLKKLMGADAKAPEVATLLSKLLTFGALGRFPMVNSLPGGMPMEEFDLEKAKEMLEASAEEAAISKEEGAEVFANVVNCMLIDIIDLASSSLREKQDVTYEAINIVIEFMNHAASLYDAVAEGVEITPVTYGGNLPKSKLEEMYGAYSFGGMMKMESDMNDRIELLRNVFAITEKKAEGIIMKASQKNMMEMMKTEDGQKQMEDMMGGMMGGMEGMEGMEGMAGMAGMMGGEGDEEPNPEQLKEMLSMLKTMKDSGSIPPEELVTVREQFRESFGSSIDDILSQADTAEGEMSDGDKELLDLMKSILED